MLTIPTGRSPSSTGMWRNPRTSIMSAASSIVQDGEAFVG